MIQDHSDPWCIKRTEESTLGKGSSVHLMKNNPNYPDLDHPEGTHPEEIDAQAPAQFLLCPQSYRRG